MNNPAPDYSKALDTDPDDQPSAVHAVPDATAPSAKKRTVLTLDQRVERIIAPQRNAYERAKKRADKARDELLTLELEEAKLRNDFERAKKMAAAGEASE